MVSAPVPFAEDPGQLVHLVVQLRGELGADEVGGPGPLAPRDQLGVLVVAAVLGGQRGTIQGEHGAQAETGGGLVDVQPFLGAAGIPPTEALALPLVSQVDGAVDRFQGVGAGAAGQVRQDFAEVFAEEVTLAVQPFLTAVYIWGGNQTNSTSLAEHPLNIFRYVSLMFKPCFSSSKFMAAGGASILNSLPSQHACGVGKTLKV